MDPTISKEEHYTRLFLNHSGSPTPEQRDALDALLGSLPTPRTLVQIMNELRQNLVTFPGAMLGEVGLDRSFHVPYNFHASPRRLTPFTVPLDHQLAILEAQMDIAVELGHNVSMHSVKSQQATVDLLSRLHKKHGDSFYRISIDMHSCGFSPETWKAVEVIMIVISMLMAH
jgi:Tat protein secretion system quality control protein TatD with DNase activity